MQRASVRHLFWLLHRRWLNFLCLASSLACKTYETRLDSDYWTFGLSTSKLPGALWRRRTAKTENLHIGILLFSTSSKFIPNILFYFLQRSFGTLTRNPSKIAPKALSIAFDQWIWRWSVRKALVWFYSLILRWWKLQFLPPHQNIRSDQGSMTESPLQRFFSLAIH